MRNRARNMRISACLVAVLLVSSAVLAVGQPEPGPSHQPGLVAQYFRDPANWGGNWPDTISEPEVKPADWTFTEYRYSRIEPLVNHLFIRQGWFTVRWTGWLDPKPQPEDPDAGCPVSGKVNINPSNSDANEFVATLKGGRVIARDDLGARFPGYEGPAVRLFVRPKGNSNENALTVDGSYYPLRNGESYEIIGEMEVNIYNDWRNPRGKAIGQWWIEIAATNALLFCGDGGTSRSDKSGAGDAYVFEILADDGCRLYVDGKRVIDDWRPCSESSPRALRRSPVLRLTEEKRRIAVEYFQGQSLEESDSDPIRLYWSSMSAGIPRQIVSPSHLSHTEADTASAPKNR